MLGKIVKTNESLVLKVKPNPEILSEETVISVTAPDVEGYILGRSDAASSYLPDIDFSVFDAKQRGISRRHAVFVNYNDMVHVMDLGSMNGTFINGTRLISYEPHALRIGDRLGLADLNIIIA
jgi:pSer/pThr/pTyr-binding forkhead associated (FHA) protein